MKLIDDHGRQVRKLRVSLTDKCNLRCHYCMPIDQQFMDEGKYLTPNEYAQIIGQLCSMGLEEVRLTGGEPLMRRSFSEIALKLSRLPLKKISLTTNAVFLDKYFDVLKEAKIFHLNISLDSLDAETFKKITFANHLERVVANIKKARELGFIVKVNVVAMKGVNDHEIMDFIKFAEDTSVEVRFLEIMRIGFACNDQTEQFISANALIKRIKLHHDLKSISMPNDSTSFNFVTEKGAQIGFIASESQPFCGQCSRWRLSADGILRACLLKDDGRSIRDMNETERLGTYQTLLGMKPAMRPMEVRHQMNAIGG